MRILSIIIFILISTFCHAQTKKLESFSVSYYGEMITHPGLKINVDYPLKEWGKTKVPNKGASFPVTKGFFISPSIGLFYHRRYQTGLFFFPEIKYKRQNPKGRFFELGIGAGYLRTFIPNTFEVNGNSEVNSTHAGSNYFATNYFFAFGRDLRIKENLPIGYFIKPQLVYVIPNFPNGTTYFILEIGIKYYLKK